MVEHAPYHCTRRLGGLPFSGRLLSRLPRGLRKAHTVAVPTRDEGEVGEKAPTTCQELARTDKDEFGEAASGPYSCRQALCRAQYGRQLRRHHPLSTSQIAPGNKWARPGDDLEIIGDKGGYASSESANKALNDAPCSNPPRG